MQKFLIIILIFISGAVLFLSCESPADVPANRRVTLDNDPDKNNYPLAIEIPGNNMSNELIFYDVSLDAGYQSKDFILFNTSSKPITIDTIIIKGSTGYFSLWQVAFPFVLAPKDEEGFSKRLYLSFKAKRIGEFLDTICFNHYTKPILRLRAIVPTVEVSNVSYGSVGIGKTLAKPITIKNHGDTPVLVNTYHIIDQESAFRFLSTLPLEIKPGASEIRIVEFAPKSEKSYSARIEFDIQASGFVNNTSLLEGRGIRQ